MNKINRKFKINDEFFELIIKMEKTVEIRLITPEEKLSGECEIGNWEIWELKTTEGKKMNITGQIVFFKELPEELELDNATADFLEKYKLQKKPGEVWVVMKISICETLWWRTDY